ncbi:dihydroxyacetone kinase subunit DhaK, partial [Aeromonas dhakensis]|uniref:dihydroxyacetone kinase subunit DhaK n=1 Tax=Aeromonas dhakensis TaxID=196024 RepID=UPI0038B69959
VYDRIARGLEDKGISIHRPFVGNYFTSLDMMGVTLTVMKLDDELAELIDAPATAPGMMVQG